MISDILFFANSDFFFRFLFLTQLIAIICKVYSLFTPFVFFSASYDLKLAIPDPECISGVILIFNAMKFARIRLNI